MDGEPIMIISMTGFGQASRTVHDYHIQVDVKSVNHRYQETMMRMPREWMHLEDTLKKRIQAKIKRGRIDMFITVEKSEASATQVELNWDLAEGYLEAAKQLSVRFGMEQSLTVKDLLLMPDIVSFKENITVYQDDVAAMLEEAVEEALDHLLAMRAAEGNHLYKDIASRLQSLETYQQEMINHIPQANQEYRDKLRRRIEDMLADLGSFDEHRFTMEVAMMADKANIDEELTRLHSHFRQCEQLLESAEPVGRKLDFLIQEMNREVNTIGSKSNPTELVSRVVDMKAELEKMREQVQNVE
jgi:uncharacterized protein (TIGR00255 family)